MRRPNLRRSQAPLRRAQVALAVIERGGRYLVCRRPPGSHLAGAWEFPGGKRRPGERWRACVLREVREELGVEVSIIGELAPIRFRYPDRRVILRPFRCRITRGRPQALAGQEMRWVSCAALRRLSMPSANRPLLQALGDCDGSVGVLYNK